MFKESRIALTIPDQVTKFNFFYAMDALASSIRRRQNVNLLGIRYDLQVYGDNGWDDVLAPGQKMGRVKGKNRLCEIYNSSKINLNITVSQCRTTSNQRIFNVPASGGFLLTDYRRGLNEIFEEDTDNIVYYTWNDLIEKVEFYLADEEERIKISDKIRKAVLENHTFLHCAKDLLNVVEAYGADFEIATEKRF